MIPAHDVDAILAARTKAAQPDLDDWAARIRDRIAVEDRLRAQVPAALRWLCDGPRRLEQTIGATLGGGLLVLWLAHRLSKP